MWKWFLMACALFCSVNWFLLPHFPRLGQYIGTLTLPSAIGLSGILVVVSLLFGKNK